LRAKELQFLFLFLIIAHIMNTTVTNTAEEKPLLAKARGALDSSSSASTSLEKNGFSRASKMVAGAAGLALVSAGTLSASRAHQAFNGLGSAASADVVTLTLGCSPTDLLSLLPFEPKSWTKAEVGVKFVSSAMSKTFDFS
jgi:hypothetical protein